MRAVTRPLHPAAQAVLQAYEDNYDKFAALAAVLRALDSQLGYNFLGVRTVDSSQIELIAAELDAIQGSVTRPFA